MLTFDTQQVYRSLASEGNFTEEQADTLTKHLRDVATLNIEHLATKEDLKQSDAALRTDLTHLEASLRNEIHHLEERMDHRFNALEQRLTIKLGGMMVVGLGVIVALQQLIGG